MTSRARRKSRSSHFFAPSEHRWGIKDKKLGSTENGRPVRTRTANMRANNNFRRIEDRFLWTVLRGNAGKDVRVRIEIFS